MAIAFFHTAFHTGVAVNCFVNGNELAPIVQQLFYFALVVASDAVGGVVTVS